MLNIKSIVLYLFSLLFCLLVSFPPPGFAQGHLTVIAGGTLIDGTGREPLLEALIIVEGDKIKTISQKGKASYPPEAKIINAEGKFILPGLIDMHVHYADWMPELFLAHGVTSIVDLAGHDWVFAQKEGVAKGKIPGPRVFASSYALGGRLFWNVPFVPIKGPEEAREAARKFIAQGVDLLKAYTEITPEELKVVVEEAQKAGLPVMGHIASLDARQAAELGIDGLAHASGVALATMADPVKVREMREFETIGISVDYPRYLLYHAFMDPGKADELIHLLVQEEVSLEPDLVNTSARWAAKRREEYKQEDERLLKDPNLRYIPENIGRRALYYEPVGGLTPEEREQLQRGYTNLQNFIRKFVEAGGRVLAGSDAASFVLPGISLHREMELLVEAGLSPMQAVMAATKNNAEFLRQQDIGTVEVGKLADLLIVRDNPLQDIRHTQAIETVIKGGEVIDTSYHPFPGSPAPGANFLVEISLGVQPKAFRMPNPEKYSGGARFWGWAEARKRSGVLHIAFGSSTAIFGGGQAIIDFVTEKKVRVQHMDTELYFPTYYVDGKKIVDNGHLLALDDPEIREVAAKYGDPDELLREDWIPKVGE